MSKEAILGRRARFLALALAGCHGGAPVADTTTVSVPTLDAAAPLPVAHPDPVVPDAGPRPVAHTKVDETIPDGTSPATRTRYERVFSNANDVHAALDDLDVLLAQLKAGRPARAEWMAFVERMNGTPERSRWMGYFCPTQNPETAAFLARVEAVRKELAQRSATLLQRAQTVLGRGDATAGEAQWNKLTDEYEAANPRPCLSVACDRW